MRRKMTCSETVSWLTLANLGATSPTRRRETPILAEKGSVPTPKGSMAFQRPASGLQIPHLLCPESYLDRSGGNLKDDNGDCCREEFTQGHLPLSGGSGIQPQGTRLFRSSTYFWASDSY